MANSSGGFKSSARLLGWRGPSEFAKRRESQTRPAARCGSNQLPLSGGAGWGCASG